MLDKIYLNRTQNIVVVYFVDRQPIILNINEGTDVNSLLHFLSDLYTETSYRQAA